MTGEHIAVVVVLAVACRMVCGRKVDRGALSRPHAGGTPAGGAGGLGDGGGGYGSGDGGGGCG